MSIAKKIIIEELENENHTCSVEHVIFWALETHSQRGSGTVSELIAYRIIHRILAEEREEELKINRNYG